MPSETLNTYFLKKEKDNDIYSYKAKKYFILKFITLILSELIKISFEEKENKVKYEEYFFNGIPFPKDIEFKDIKANSLKVYWKMNDLNILNIDKNKIKFKIEIKKENSDNNFIKIYEGNEMNYLLI